MTVPTENLIGEEKQIKNPGRFGAIEMYVKACLEDGIIHAKRDGAPQEVLQQFTIDLARCIGEK